MDTHVCFNNSLHSQSFVPEKITILIRALVTSALPHPSLRSPPSTPQISNSFDLDLGRATFTRSAVPTAASAQEGATLVAAP